jgi:hypothetical protein
MAQLNVYMADDLEQKIRREAKRLGKSISAYLQDLAIKESGQIKGWKKNFFVHVAGGWQGNFPKISRNLPEERDDL